MFFYLEKKIAYLSNKSINQLMVNYFKNNFHNVSPIDIINVVTEIVRL